MINLWLNKQSKGWKMKNMKRNHSEKESKEEITVGASK